MLQDAGATKGAFKKNVFIQNKRTRISIFFLVFIYVLLFSTETLPFYLYVLFSMALGENICSKKIN